jgi:protein-S-isoprenylcysteine O-methyltransferase Ste14
MGRLLFLLYGIIAYVLFLISFLYAVGFVGNFLVPKSIDSGNEVSFVQALIINALLLSLFAIQHSVMARRGFKRWWTKIIPKSIERSTFVLLTSLILLLIFWQWRPMLGTVWNVESNFGIFIFTVMFWFGWFVVFVATFMINHFDLFGLRQVYLNFIGKEYTPLKFQENILYKYVRHPIMLGFIIAFWASPTMTVGHLVFALATTGYILFAIQLEERDLISEHGKKYEYYRQRASMLFPIPKKNKNISESKDGEEPVNVS